MTGPFLTVTAALLATSPMIAPPAHAPAPRLAPASAPSSRTAAAPISRAAFIARLDGGYRSLDANQDGVVTATELASAEARARQAADAALAARRHDAFARLDTNRDGQLSQAEFDAAAAALPRPPASDPAAVLAALDSDHDQRVSLTEYRARGLARFDRADVNHDGIVTPEEERAGVKR